MNDSIISAAYTTYVNKGTMALLIGSGVSRESEIPTGWDITLSLIRQIAILQGINDMPDPDQWYKETYGEGADYSHLLERLTNSPEERINLLKPFFEPSPEEFEEGVKRHSSAHRYIARLVQEGYIRVIVTTNFDRLIENALKEVGIEPTIISNPNHIDSVMPLIHARITIIKLNGDYLDTGFLNLKGELSAYDVRFEPLLSEVFENFGLITCGWSGRWDTGLVESLKSHHKFRFTNFYTYLNDPSVELKSVSDFRKGYLISIDNASNFFKELFENVTALNELGSRHPLTEQVAIRRVKKYVADPGSRVLLHDLVHELAGSTLNSIRFDLSRSPTTESVMSNMEMCLLQIRPLSATMAQGTYWSDLNQYPIWQNVVLMALDLRKKFITNSWSDWDSILRLPALVLRYTMGIAYVANKKWDLLKLLHQVSVKENNQSRNIIRLTDPMVVINKKYLYASGYKYKTPMSKKLFEYLHPLFESILPTSDLYTETFDLYELISALMYMKDMEHDLDHGPIARLCHTNPGLLNEVKVLSDSQKNSYYMIETGLFTSYDEFSRILKSYSDVAVKAAMFE